MANILQIDPDETAQIAMGGILTRGGHRFAGVESGGEAWDLIQRSVQVDMVLAELKLKGEMSGLQLIEKLKGDCLRRAIPIVVCTGHAERNSVKRVLELQAQNILLKPYHDQAILAEVAKAVRNPWWMRAFAHPNSPPSGPVYRRPMIEALRGGLERVIAGVRSLQPNHDVEPVVKAFEKLALLASRAGAVSLHECLENFATKAQDGRWPTSKKDLEPLEFAVRLMSAFLEPKECPEDFITEEEANAEAEARDRAFWADAPAEGRCPMADRPQLERQIEKLSGCPIVASSAAAFRMAATGHPTSLSPLRDLIAADPGLMAEILIAANRLKKKGEEGDASTIEETRMAVGLLGENRLAALGGNFELIEDRTLLAPPYMSWPKFRMFQLGTARLARYVCEYLEMPHLASAAYTGGLIHDIGKLLLARIFPFAFQAIYEHAVRQGTRLAAAERHFLQMTTLEMAAHFGRKQGLPRTFVNVLRWLDDAEEASEDAELVAIVSLARDLCRRNQVGFAGDTPQDEAVALAETPEWRVLGSRVYVNFDLRKFEEQADRECRTLRRELLDEAVDNARI